jgi:hypothetical protein
MGSLLNKVDQASGVTQASPGADSNSGYVSSGWNGSVSDGNSIIRLKVYDDPLPQPEKDGILNYFVEFEFIESLFDGAVNTPPVDILKLTIDKIEIVQAEKPDNPTVIIPNFKERQIEIRRSNHFLPLVMGLTLQSGTYSSIKVFLNSKGFVYFNDKEYELNVTQKVISFDQSILIEPKKITSLRSIPSLESQSAFFSNNGQFKRENFVAVKFVDYVFHKNQAVQFNLSLNLVTAGQSLHSPINKLNIMVSQVSAVDKSNSSFTLNAQPTIFEFLSLRNGFVGLAAHSEVSVNEFNYFEIILGRNNSIDIEGNNSPLLMDDRSPSVFRFQGSFPARNARILELFMHLDPNKSIFYVPNKGFVFDPVLKLESMLNMTSEQVAILSSRLYKGINLVSKDSEYVISGTTTDIKTLLAKNTNGKQMIYSDVTIQVNDVLRGDEVPKILSLRVIGGSYGGTKLEVFGMPKFQMNESFLLFLKKNGKSFIITHGELGKVNL